MTVSTLNNYASHNPCLLTSFHSQILTHTLAVLLCHDQNIGVVLTDVGQFLLYPWCTSSKKGLWSTDRRDVVTRWAALPVMWPIIGRFPCTLVAITMTSTCFLKPATSSGHLGPFHLGDESVLHTLTHIFSHHCQHLPSSLPHHQPVGLFSVLLKFSSCFRSPISFSHLLLCLRLCVSASTPCICVLHPHHHTPYLSNSSLSPESLHIMSPHVFKHP